MQRFRLGLLPQLNLFDMAYNHLIARPRGLKPLDSAPAPRLTPLESHLNSLISWDTIRNSKGGQLAAFVVSRGNPSLLVQERPHLSLTELGKTLNRDISPLGRAGRRLRMESAQGVRLRKVIEKVRGRAAGIAER